MKSALAGLTMLMFSSAFAADPSEACFNGLEQVNQLSPLRSLLALGSIRNQTLEMMSNPRHPTPVEKEAIKAWVRERDQCLVIGEDWRKENMAANMRSIMDNYYAKNKLLIAELYQAKITYGEFGIRRAAMSAELSTNLNAGWRASRRRPSDPSYEAREERQRAESRAAMLATATRIFEGDGTQSAGTSAQTGCAGKPGARTEGGC